MVMKYRIINIIILLCLCILLVVQIVLSIRFTNKHREVTLSKSMEEYSDIYNINIYFNISESYEMIYNHKNDKWKIINNDNYVIKDDEIFSEYMSNIARKMSCIMTDIEEGEIKSVNNHLGLIHKAIITADGENQLILCDYKGSGSAGTYLIFNEKKYRMDDRFDEIFQIEEYLIKE